MTALDSKGALNLQVLTSFPNEFEASPVLDALRDNGIRAEAVGGYTAGFIAEAPGSVSILVRQADLQAARKILEDIRADLAVIDWATVDVGDDGDSEGRGEPEKAEVDATEHQQPLQYSITSLLVAQTVVAVVCGLLLGPAAGLIGIVVVAMVVAATVYAGSDLHRTRQVWSHFGRVLTIGTAIWLLTVLARIAWDAVVGVF